MALLPLRERGRITRLRRGVVCSEVAARNKGAAGTNPSRLKDEPRQGCLSVQFFERGKPLFGYRFSSGDEGLFCDTIFPKEPLCPIVRKRCAMTGFIRVSFFKRKAIVIVCFKTRRDGVF